MLRRIGVRTRHQAVAWGCLARVITVDDVLPAAVPAAAPSVEVLALPQWLPDPGALLGAMRTGRAVAVVPHSGQVPLVDALVRSCGGRVLVLAPGPAEWAHTVALLRRSRPGRHVVAVLSPDDRTRVDVRALGVAPPLSTAAGGVPHRLGGTTPLVAVATPAGVRALAHVHEQHPDGLGPWDLLVDLDPLAPGSGSVHAARTPALARLTISAVEDAVDPDRHHLLPGPAVVRATPADLHAAQLARPYRLLAAAPSRGGGSALQRVVADLAARPGVHRVLVHCATPAAALDTVRGLRTALEHLGQARPATWWAATLSAGAAGRARALEEFAAGPRALRVLATTGPLPGTETDALVHAAWHRPDPYTAQVIGHALTARPGAAPLLLVAPVLAAPETGSAQARAPLASLAAAVAALDPDLREHLRRTRLTGRHTVCRDWLEHTTHTITSAGLRRLVHTAAHADTPAGEDTGHHRRAPARHPAGPAAPKIPSITNGAA